MDKKMSYQATNFLADLFGPTPSTAALAPEPGRQPEPVAAPVFDPADRATPDEPPSSGGEPQAADIGPSGFDPANWIRQPDVTGRWGWQRADFDVADCPDFETLPDVLLCPRCGSLEAWQSIASDRCGIDPGRWRCLHCDPPTKSRAVAAQAAKLRRLATARPTTADN